MMSNIGKQITQQQWGIVFSGKKERSSGKLGVVSILIEEKNLTDRNKDYTLQNVKGAFDQMSFSSTQQFRMQNRIQIPNSAYGNPSNNYILHLDRGNIYPNTGPIRILYESNKNGLLVNKTILDGFKR